METIAASSWDAVAPDPGRYSFTNCLIEVLLEWKGRQYSVTMLHAEILVRLKHPRPIMVNGKSFEARGTPVYFSMSSNFRMPSIEIASMIPAEKRDDEVRHSSDGTWDGSTPAFTKVRDRSGFKEAGV